MDISGIHCPLSQNMTLSTPTNQSGEGVMCDARETWKHKAETSKMMNTDTYCDKPVVFCYNVKSAWQASCLKP